MGGAGTVAGCLGGGPSYQFTATDAGGDIASLAAAHVVDDLTETRAQYAIDYSQERKASIVGTLFERGEVTVRGFQLTHRDAVFRYDGQWYEGDLVIR